MSDAASGDERRARNLQAVARRLAREAPASASPDAAPPAPRPAFGWLARLGPIGVVVGLALGKLKLLIPLLKVTKLSTIVTMLLSIWVYAQFFGTAFAVGFVLLIFVHELGHALVMRQQGIHAGAPVFIPFVGAVIAMKSLPRNAWVEALVAIGGPISGGLAALACLVAASLSGSLFWYALASSGFLINLFNLMPISPLDGGRIVGVISRWLWVLGYALCIGVFVTTWHPMLLLILVFGLLGLGRTIRGARTDYFDVRAEKRVAMGVAYFGLAALLTLGMQLADRPLEELRRGRLLPQQHPEQVVGGIGEREPVGHDPERAHGEPSRDRAAVLVGQERLGTARTDALSRPAARDLA